MDSVIAALFLVFLVVIARHKKTRLICVLRTTKRHGSRRFPAKQIGDFVRFTNSKEFWKSDQNLRFSGHFGKTVKFYEFWCFMKIPEISYQKYRSRHFWTYLFGKRSKTPHPRPYGSRQCFQDIAQQWDESSESSRCVGPLQLCGGV